jgi:hypothetical protein
MEEGNHATNGVRGDKRIRMQPNPARVHEGSDHRNGPDGLDSSEHCGTGTTMASGMREPAVCFGCKGIKEYENHCHHFLRNCPNKGNRRTWTNFHKNLKEFMEQKKNRGGQSHYQPQKGGEGNWKREGYFSLQTADHVQAIASPTTSAATKRVLLAALATQLQEAKDDNEQKEEKGTDAAIQKRKRSAVGRNSC